MHGLINVDDWIAELPADVRDAIHDRFQPVDVEAGANFSNAGDAPSAIFQVERGHLKLLGHQEDGRRILITIYSGGACFAKTAVVARRPLNHSTTAMTQTRVNRLLAADFWDLYARHPAIPDALCRKFAGTISRQVAAREMRASQRLGKHISAMIEGLIFYCGEPFRDGSVRITLPLTQTDIAEHFDVTRQSVQREITILKTAGIISKRDGFWWVLDRTRLDAIQN